MNTIYLVDDDQLVLDTFLMKRSLFMECGFEICKAETNPLKAFNDIRELRPDAVLSDMKMPQLNGIGLLEALRRENIPILFVIISAYNDFADVRKFFTVTGGFDYLLKPVSDRELTELLGRISTKIYGGTTMTEITETPSRELNEILKYLGEYYAMNHTLEIIGRISGINPNTVCNLFAKHLNTTFIAYLTTLRMKKAAELLYSTDMAVKDIGMRCGYSSYFYFTKVFSKTYGKSPTQYREATLYAK
ncbi:MAG: helix-turn-helix domain-containing protein [Oscillospiraceae bacterium]|jgi:YesN/AraC family two-component response regulator|nr:helix-turn-helix domain-containing protein [Oscillospiraceae bacterium]